MKHAGILLTILANLALAGGLIAAKSESGSPVAQTENATQTTCDNIPKNEISVIVSSQIPNVVRIVSIPAKSPLFGFDELEKEFLSVKTNKSQSDLALDETCERWESQKKAGITKWKSETWMKSPEYYKSLKTMPLLAECFEKSIFGFELKLYNDHRYGIASLKIFHDGFAELFDRKDLYDGVLFLYKELTSKITLDISLNEMVKVSLIVDSLGDLYLYSPLKEQVREREMQFFEVNVELIKRYLWYLENYDYKTLGTQGSAGFYCEPCSVVQCALLMLSQIDESKYLSAKKELANVEFDESQNLEQLRSYLALAVKLFQ